MNPHALNLAVDRKVLWDDLMRVGQSGACVMAGVMNSLSSAQDANYTPVWSETEKTAMRLEQDLVDDWEL